MQIEDPPSLPRKCAVTSTAPALLAAGRAFGVVYGPSLLAMGLLGGTMVAAARKGGGRPLRTRPTRSLQALASVAAAVPIAYLLLARPWLLRWGATADEVHQPLPGDELAPHPWIESTRAVTIHAPVEAVWPWLAQIGQDRGGFYSYEALENLAGCEMRNADYVHPEWQQRVVGDTIPLHPRAGLKLKLFEPNRALVLEGWGAFVLEPIDEQTTRLIARSRGPRSWTTLALGVLGEIPHFVMERKMLLGIKERAEPAWARDSANRIRTGPAG
jgi:hypothetical protein